MTILIEGCFEINEKRNLDPSFKYGFNPFKKAKPEPIPSKEPLLIDSPKIKHDSKISSDIKDDALLNETGNYLDGWLGPSSRIIDISFREEIVIFQDINGQRAVTLFSRIGHVATREETQTWLLTQKKRETKPD